MRNRANRLLMLLAIAVLAQTPAAIAAPSDGVHPGAIVNSDVGQCTENFLFDGSDGNRYIGSAGHCVLAAPELGGTDIGEKTWSAGSGPVARDSNNQRIGEWAYAILQDPKDFSLIRLDPGVAATAQMPSFGGPTGIFTAISSNVVLLQYYGEGIGVSSIAPARNAVALGTPDPDHVYAQGIVVPGDSGSAIETDGGLAVGVIVTTGVHTGSVGSSGVDAGSMGVTRLPPQLARAAQVLGIKLTLRTAPLLDGTAGSVVAPTTGSGQGHGGGGGSGSGPGASGGGNQGTSAPHSNSRRRHAKAKKKHHSTRHSRRGRKHNPAKHR